MFPFFQACRSMQTQFLVRAAQNRRVQESEEEITYSLTLARSWPSQASRVLAMLAQRTGGSPLTMTVGTDLGREWHAWVAIWRAPMMALLAGEPSGKDSFSYRPFSINSLPR